MKKLFLFLMIFGVSVIANAQAPTAPVLSNNKIGNLLSTPSHSVTDTITNTTVKNQYGLIGGFNAVVTVQSIITKLSGTGAGSVKLQGSLDGLNWVQVGSTYTITDVASQTVAFTVSPSSYAYYRINVTPTGTQSQTIESKVLIRK